MQRIRKVLLFVFVISAVFVLKISAQSITSEIDYSITIKDELAAEVSLTQKVFNTTLDQVVTDISINIPYTGINILEVTFNDSSFNYDTFESLDSVTLNVNLGSNIIKPGENGTVRIKFLHRKLVKESNYINSIKIDKLQSNQNITTTVIKIDYSQSGLPEPSFISSAAKHSNKIIEINDGEVLVLWSNPGNFNLSFLQELDANTSEDLLFNFINEDYYENVSYTDLKEFEYGLKDFKNNHYGVTKLRTGQNTIGFISALLPAQDTKMQFVGDEFSNLISFRSLNLPEYNSKEDFKTNLNFALSNFREALITQNSKFQSIHDYYLNQQSPLDQCLYLSKLGEAWNFGVEIIAGIMTHDYNVLNSNQNIWCKIAHQDKVYSVDYYLQRKLDYDFVIEGDFADRLPILRMSSNAVDSFFVRYFKDLDLKISKNPSSIDSEIAEATGELKAVNQSNYSGEPVNFNLQINNPSTKFLELSSLKINDIDINLQTRAGFIYTLLPQKENIIPIQVILEKDFFAKVAKNYYAEIVLSSGQVITASGLINLEIDYINLALNFTLVLLIIILLIYIVWKYIRNKKEKPLYIKK